MREFSGVRITLADSEETVTELEIQARATIAAALIVSGTFDVTFGRLYEPKPFDHIPTLNLHAAVDRLYRCLTDPR